LGRLPAGALDWGGSAGSSESRPMITAFADWLQGSAPILALAPMQDVTDLEFWRLIHRYGGPDVYFTEYFRVHGTSTLESWILESIVENPTGRPVVAQVIGGDLDAMVRSVRQLQEYPVAGIDLNLGCPAPVVCRKSAGGGLLRDPGRIDVLLAALREAVAVPLSVKTRIGYDSAADFDRLLGVLARHRLDCVTVHARTVVERYRSEVRYEFVKRAVGALPCPVLVNGNVFSAARAEAVLEATGARGWMIGRGAIRNPWIFEQIRCRRAGRAVPVPDGRAVLEYVEGLLAATSAPALREASHIQRVKKHMNYIALGVEPTGRFLHAIRRVTTIAEFLRLCREHLDHDRPLLLEPFAVPLGPRDILAGEAGC